MSSKVTIPLEKPLRYDPEAIAQKYCKQKMQVFKRSLQVLLAIVDFTFKWWLNRKIGLSKQKQLRQAVRLREILTRLGPAYIKIGQALSTRSDLLPSVYIDELAKLQDQLPSFSNELAYKFIQEELGKTPDQIYAELSPEPIAAASLGQVYQGRLPTGEVVAVKVQRPDLAEKIALDIYILRNLATFFQKRYQEIPTNLVTILDEFATRLFEEMDYIQEGKNAEQFANLYGELTDIYVPKIYWEYTNRRVLTMEWIKGTKLTHLAEIQSQGIDARSLVEVGVQCTLRQLLEHGFFHADPHPGNLLAMENGKLAYLDFGMMSEIKPDQRYALINAVVHIVNRDFSTLVQDYIELEFLPPDADITPISAALTKLFNDALTSSVAQFNFQVIIQQLSELMYQYSFQVPAYYALIIRSLVALEGIAISIDPDFKVLVSAYPYVLKRLLTDPAPQLQPTFNNLLFNNGSFRWYRLETILMNFSNTKDFNFGKALDQGVSYLLSEQGKFVRIRLADELLNLLDAFGETLLSKTPVIFGMQMSSHHQNLAVNIDPEMLEYLKRIWILLQKLPGFDSIQIAQAVAKILMIPITHETGQYIVKQVLQRSIKRLRSFQVKK
ncbi:AarF/ABC1/UbiB kinase family protein [Tolypothrix sp. PCC 7910]|uniref:ABC1 kinase family protein n=1 Tax=Tolypothrix sp. PCC 7910 TaxID=2099387 RepID=UPI001427A083|nr:AarF/ABC1/UbiB kinase family protein [Tolypothrix sp. PCC 7910]QIR35839.1 AarF/ABC1/UbiB kinase family protein [Tolypothrix sp. PCC 7910]